MAPWQILKVIGKGAVGEVYLAVSPTGERVAVKLLSPARRLEMRALEAEAAALVHLRHPSLVTIQRYLTQSGEIFGEDRGPCYWMELIDGKDLLTAAKGANPSTILVWFREALEAIRYLHSQGVLHGDLSPQNILIDLTSRLKIIDFGLAPERSGFERATLPYMAPERIDGRALPAGDLFSLGTIFYEALAGVHPRASCHTLQDLIRHAPVPLIEAAPHLGKDQSLFARVIDRMIRADLSERLQDAGRILEIFDQGRWRESSVEAAEYHPVRMYGAEKHFEVVYRALEEAGEHPVVIGIHGTAGVGKSRFLREIGFEAAIRDVPFRGFPEGEDLDRLFTFLKCLPPKKMLVAIEWNDDRLDDESRRFFSHLLSSGMAREIHLTNLNTEETLSFLKGPLDASSAEEAAPVVHQRTRGNPGLILETLRHLGSEGKIRGRVLLPGWRDLVREIVPPAEILKTRGCGVSPDEIKDGVLKVAEKLWDERKNGEALEVIDYATPLISDSAEISRLLRLKTNILNRMQRLEEAIVCADQWFALKAPDEPFPLKTVKYWFITGLNHHNLGHEQEAQTRLEKCLENGKSHEEDPPVRHFLARARSLLGLAAANQGNSALAETHFRKGLDLAEPAGTERAEILRNLAGTIAHESDWQKAIPLLQEAAEIYRKANDANGEFWAKIQEGNLAIERNDSRIAESAYRAAERLGEATGSSIRLAVAWNNIGVLDRSMGRLAEALNHLQRARDTFLFLGNKKDICENLRHLAIAEAEVGRFERAEELIRELGESSFADEARDLLRGLKEGTGGETRGSLQTIFNNLPPELQVTFVERGDYKKWFKPGVRPMTTTSPSVHPVGAYAALTELNRNLLLEEDMNRVLTRLMDSAMEIAGAESGFLVLKAGPDSARTGPLPGFEVAISRNILREEIDTDSYAFSLSAIRRVLMSGETVVTDNALEDPVFRKARSVQLRGLKSILALPIRVADEILGVFYLDHRFQEGLFEGELLEALEAFAGIAALALQKGQMIEELRRSNSRLSDEIQTQSNQVHLLEREVNNSRLILKNEYCEIIGRSPKMVEVLSLVDRITDAKVPVWIYGESGTGKEAIARALHFNSARAKKPFVTENCSALPESLLESELFGHKKGAFTHAIADKKGILQYADGGTIFLDEIADMSMNLQAKLLRFLQEGEFRPIGSHEAVRVDVRVVSASNKDLDQLVREGKFREDLFFRINGVTVNLPPLRERIDDLPLLAGHFLKKISEREKKEPCRLDPDALGIFVNYPWPGNIRELQNTLETASLFADNGVITAQSLHFKPVLFMGKRAQRRVLEKKAPSERLDPEREKTLLAIRDHCYHKGNAAKALGISRRSLYARLDRFGLPADAMALRAHIEKHLG